MPTTALRTLTAIALWLANTALAQAVETPVYLTNGKTLAATAVTMIDADHVLFATPAGEKAVAQKELLKWGALRDNAQGLQVVLADGSVLVASDVHIADEKLVVETNLFGAVEGFKLQGTLQLPLDSVRAVLLCVPIDPRERDRQMANVLAASGNADELLLANGDVMSGTLKKLEPAAGDGDRPGRLTATLETSAGEVAIASDRLEGRLSDKIAAIIFNPQLVRTPPSATALMIGFADGSRLLATKVEANDEQATFVTAVATIVSHPDENIWPKITSLQSLRSDVKYLSQLPATGYKHVPLVGAAWPLGVNENVLGEKLRSGQRLYLRGLGMHAASRVVFALDRPYTKLQAELAIDDSAGDAGSVTFLVLSADAGGTFKPIYKSPVIRGGDAPTPIALDIAGAKRIALLVEPADHGDALDRANWLDARLLP